MGVWLGPRGANGEGKAPLFTITKNGSPATLGTDYLYAENTVNGVVHWELAVLTSCTVNFSRVGKVDLALLAGGQAGSLGSNGKGGVGGKGGGITTASDVQLTKGTDYAAVIGGSGENTTFAGYTATSGQGSNGGTPSSTRNVPPVDGADGTTIWNGSHEIASLANVKFGPGGGAGGYRSSDYAYYSGSDGGDDGGGDGGEISQSGTTAGEAGTANRGAGAGGAYLDDVFGANGQVGTGGSGILLIRDHRG